MNVFNMILHVNSLLNIKGEVFDQEIIYNLLISYSTHLLSWHRIVEKSFIYSTVQSSYLVDPASSHMLVSKIKPCMSKYKQLCTVKLRMAH